MPFNLFRKKKQPEQEKPAVPPQEKPKQKKHLPDSRRSKPEPSVPAQEPTQETTAPTVKQPMKQLHRLKSKNRKLLNLQAKPISKLCLSKNYLTLKT